MIPVVERSKAWVGGRPLAKTAGSNPAGSMDVLSLVIVLRCLVEVSAMGRSLIQRIHTECMCVVECD